MATTISVNKQTIEQFLLNARTKPFIIPDYQRPYAWEEDECRTLWNDLFTFAFPNDDSEKFDDTEEYYLGPIVTFKNNDKIIFAGSIFDVNMAENNLPIYTEEELAEIEAQQQAEEEKEYDFDYDEYEDYYNEEDDN